MRPAGDICKDEADRIALAQRLFEAADAFEVAHDLAFQCRMLHRTAEQAGALDMASAMAMDTADNLRRLARQA